MNTASASYVCCVCSRPLRGLRVCLGDASSDKFAHPGCHDPRGAVIGSAQKRITRHDATPETREAWATIDAAAARAPLTAEEIQAMAPPEEEEIAAAWDATIPGAVHGIGSRMIGVVNPWDSLYPREQERITAFVRALLSGTGRTGGNQ